MKNVKKKFGIAISISLMTILFNISGFNGTQISINRTVYATTVNKSLSPIVCIDSPSANQKVNKTINISGWSLNASSVKEVDVYIDGAYKGKATIGISRPDVNKAYPSYKSSNSGYKYTLDINQISYGSHAITVKSLGKNGSIGTNSVKVNVNKLAQLLTVDSPSNNLNILNTLNVSGWTLNASGVKEVDVYVDGKLNGRATLGIKRLDVAARYPVYKNAKSGYSYTINTTNLADGKHKITINAVGNDGGVSSKTVSVQKLSAILNIDSPSNSSYVSNTVKVSGWSLDPSSVKEVDVYVDGKLKDKATLGIKRLDIAVKYPIFKNSKSGYSYNLNTSPLSIGNHTITVKSIGNSGKVLTSSRTIFNTNNNGIVYLTAVQFLVQRLLMAKVIQTPQNYVNDALGKAKQPSSVFDS